MPEPQRMHEEQDREESLGKRVRRFVESEVTRTRDRSDPPAGAGGDHRDYREDPHPAPVLAGGPAPQPREIQPREIQSREIHEREIPEPAPKPEHQPADRIPVGGDSAERVGLFNDVPALREQWQRVQGRFVDDPQLAVHEAGRLVDRTLEEIRANVGSERPSDAMSTEDLRVSFRRYREFFERLLSA